jgi:hypothetical protein
MIPETNTAAPSEKTAAQHIEQAVNASAVTALLSGDWMTDEVCEQLRADAEEYVMQRVMSGLSPDLRTLMADRRSELRVVVRRRVYDLIVKLHLHTTAT